MREVRTITTLFTDVVGSTELLARHGADGADRIRRGHFANMRAALTVHRGREVKTLGDGFMAAFAGAGDAISCAVTMQRATSREGGPSIRIGISAGDATTENGDWFGAPVVEASRLCAAAAPGQILLSEVVRLLSGRAAEQLEPMGPLRLKGLAAPVTAYAVSWEPDATGRLRVALADDSVLIRQGLGRALREEGMEVVLEVADGEALLDGIAAARPHVAVVDMRMPPTFTTEGLHAAERIRAEHPDVAVLVLSAQVEPSAARRLLAGPARGVGYLLKDRVVEMDDLTAAIRTLAAGGSAIDPEVVTLLGALEAQAPK